MTYVVKYTESKVQIFLFHPKETLLRLKMSTCIILPIKITQIYIYLKHNLYLNSSNNNTHCSALLDFLINLETTLILELLFKYHTVFCYMRKKYEGNESLFQSSNCL